MEPFKRSNGVLLLSPSCTRVSGWADYLKIRHGKVQERPWIRAEKKATLHVQRLPRNGVTMWRPLDTQASSVEISVKYHSHCWPLLPFSLLGDSGNLPLPVTSVSPSHTTPHQISAMWNLVPSFAMNTLWETPIMQYSDVWEAQIRSIVWLK